MEGCVLYNLPLPPPPPSCPGQIGSEGSGRRRCTFCISRLCAHLPPNPRTRKPQGGKRKAEGDVPYYPRPPAALTPRAQTRWEPSGRWRATSLLLAFALALAPERKPNGAQAKGGGVLPRTTQPPRSGAQTKWEAGGRRRGMFPNTCVFPRVRPRARAQTESEAGRRRRGPFCATYLGPRRICPRFWAQTKWGKAEGGGVRFVLVVFILARAPKPGRIPNGEANRR